MGTVDAPVTHPQPGPDGPRPVDDDGRATVVSARIGARATKIAAALGVGGAIVAATITANLAGSPPTLPPESPTTVVSPSSDPTPASPRPSPPVDQRPDGSGCPPFAQADAVPAVVERTAPGDYPVALGLDASYKLFLEGPKVEIEVGGSLIGTIPPGKTLALLIWANPQSRDVDGNAGNGVYYRSSTLRVTGNCWIRPQREIAYAGAQGITFRQHLVLVDESRLAEFLDPRYEAGYNDVTLDALEVEHLGYFDIPTAQ